MRFPVEIARLGVATFALRLVRRLGDRVRQRVAHLDEEGQHVPVGVFNNSIGNLRKHLPERVHEQLRVGRVAGHELL